MHKTAVLLLNIGSPATPSIDDVCQYLNQYLIDKYRSHYYLPLFIQKLLVSWILAPLRAPHSAALYRQLISQNGLPLYYYTKRLCDELQEMTDSQTDIFIAMNYGIPSIKEVLQDIWMSEKYNCLIFVPLFPQFSIPTTQSIINNINKQIKNFPASTKVKFIKSFYRHPLFIDTWTKYIQTYNPYEFNHIIFSFHGLPIGHLPKNCRKQGDEKSCACLKFAKKDQNLCYRGSCFEMTEILAERLRLKKEYYSVAFQSNFGKKWTQPPIKPLLIELAERGIESILVVPLSFVSDCVETTIEIGQEYRSLFLASGGKRFEWTTGLNDCPKWLSTLRNIIREVEGV